jgi:hypothetical protein
MPKIASQDLSHVYTNFGFIYCKEEHACTISHAKFNCHQRVQYKFRRERRDARATLRARIYRACPSIMYIIHCTISQPISLVYGGV